MTAFQHERTAVPKRRGHKPKRASPLIDPAVSALVLIFPDRDDIAGSAAAGLATYQRRIAAIAAAADIADVPTFVLSHSAREPEVALLGLLPKRRRHVIASSPLVALWQNDVLIEALDREDRSMLVLAGIWLEYHVLATALHALTDGYDVYITVDATPAQSDTAAIPSMHRLLQFGATPVLASQVVHEWCLESSDAEKRSALNNLLTGLLATMANG